MISDKKEALYLVDNESYLHLKEMEAGFAYEAFDKSTGAAQYTGLITYEDMLENPIRNPLACARVMAIQRSASRVKWFPELLFALWIRLRTPGEPIERRTGRILMITVSALSPATTMNCSASLTAGM